METREIESILLHVPQQIEGSPKGSVNAKKYKLTLSLVLPIGVQVTGPNTDLLVPFSNIQGVYFERK